MKKTAGKSKKTPAQKKAARRVARTAVPVKSAPSRKLTGAKLSKVGEELKAHRLRQQVENNAKHRAAAREIGECPAVKDPVARALYAHDLLGFLKHYLPRRFTMRHLKAPDFSPDHLDLIRSVQAITLHGGLRSLALPRGSGKTTILIGACLWALLYGHRRFLFVIAATAEKALELMDSLQKELAGNDHLLEDFPEVCFPIRALGGVPQRAMAQTMGGRKTRLVFNTDEVRLPCMAAGGGSIIKISGIDGAVRGAQVTLDNGEIARPDLALIDDFQTRKSARSPSQTAGRLQIIRGDVLELSGPGQKIAAFCACTIIYQGDGAAQLLDRKKFPEWRGTTASMMRSMPNKAAMVKWEEYMAIVREDMANEAIDESETYRRGTEFYRKNRKAMDAGAVASWSERRTPGELSATQHAFNKMIDIGEDAFYAECQNAPRSLSAADAVPQVDPEAVAERINGVPMGIVPAGTQEVCAFIDVGEGNLWWQAGAFADPFRGDSIGYGAYPDPARGHFTKLELAGAIMRVHPQGTIQEAVYEALGALCGDIMEREWKGEDGSVHRIGLCLIDAGQGLMTDTVFNFCKQSKYRDRLMPSRGKGITATNKDMADWTIAKGDRLGNHWILQRNKKRGTKEVVVDVNWWKCFVADRLMSPMGNPARFALPGLKPGDHEMYAAHMASEMRKRVTSGVRTVDVWVPKPGQDNDLWDTAVGMHVAASIKGIKAGDSSMAPMRRREDRGPAKTLAQMRAEAQKRKAG